MTDQAFTSDQVADLRAPDDQYELETDQAIEAGRLISRHIPTLSVPDDALHLADVRCSCGIVYHTDNDEYALVEWAVHLGVELDQAELLQR